MRYFLSIACLVFWGLASSITHAGIQIITSSQNLITAENGYVTFVVEATSAPERPQITVKNALFQLYDTNVIAQQGKRYYLFTYRFNSPNAGIFSIPATTFTTANPEDISEPITLTVRDENTLIKHTIDSMAVDSPQGPIRKTYHYYTQLIAEKTSLFPNEVTRLEYKIYLPKYVNVKQWGLPSGERKNATAWRFETPNPLVTSGDVVIDGRGYQVGRFHTTVSGINSGKAILGPFKTRVVHNASMIDTRGSYLENQEISPLSEVLELEILDLPPNPPADFKGDVGNFQMSAIVESKPELKTTESIRAEVTLRGRGKFSEISPPSLTNDEHWKLISDSKRDLGEQRKNINAFAEFTYLIQPANTGPAGATTTPGFSFSYLDPDLKAYRTLSHPGVPVVIKLTSNSDDGTAEIAKAANQMLGIINETDFTKKPWYKSLPLSFIHIIPGVLFLLLLLKYAHQKRLAIRLSQSHRIIQRKSLRELEQQDGESFLKSASNYIQRWVDTDKYPELRDIPQLRDEQCYQPQEPIKFSEKRKIAVINTLKKLIILLFFVIPQLSDAAADALWEKGEYTKALTQYEAQLKPSTQSADLLYNIGNCHQKLNQPGKAAVFYHRALIENPDHSQAKHNLSFLQKQNNSVITESFILTGSMQYWISKLSLATYYITLSISLWLVLLTILWLKVIKPKKHTNLMLMFTILASLTAAMSGYGYFKHPYKEKNASLPLAVVIKSSTLITQPIAESKPITTLPPASECRILTNGGTYTFIELADKSQTSGWILSADLLRVVEDQN
jgi:tetratricopeptide (TPR) repeat protein